MILFFAVISNGAFGYLSIIQAENSSGSNADMWKAIKENPLLVSMQRLKDEPRKPLC